MNKRRVKGQKQAKTSKTLFLWEKKKRGEKKKKTVEQKKQKQRKKKELETQPYDAFFFLYVCLLCASQ